MARPRVFISSTYYDLRHIREDVAQFLRDQGYEPVLFERGEIPYGRKEAPQEYCYKEIKQCDILVSLVGGRLGAQSSTAGYSISQKELRFALEEGKQVYIFVEKNVRAEYETYQENKGSHDIKYKYVDSTKIYEFIDELYSLPRNNSIFTFEYPQDIARVLREQWAGLFQRLLQEEAERPVAELGRDLRNSIATLQQIVGVMTKENGDRQKAISDVLTLNHPAYARVAKVLSISYRIVFSDLSELSTLMDGRGYDPVLEDRWDEPDVMEWVKVRGGTQYLFKAPKSLFNADDKLKLVCEANDIAAIRIEKSAIAESVDDD